MPGTQTIVDIAALRRSCAQCSLQQLCLPAGIGAEDLKRLDEVVRKRRPLGRGDALFRVGSPLGSLFVAREGAFKTVALSEDGTEQVIGFHLPGELLGLDALGEGVHRCDAHALEPAEVCEVPLDELGAIAARIPSLHQQLLRVIGQSMGRDHDHLAMMGRRHANERVALFLHGLSERLQRLGRDPDHLTLPMSREEIASYLGLVIETVSRTFSRLQDEGVISVRGRKLQVLDRARLDLIAHDPEEARSR
ncbi:MAG: helix-turn-helix domain-containing protein [Lysobacteraceae bacterium]